MLYERMNDKWRSQATIGVVDLQMFENPPPDGKRVTATSASCCALAPGGRNVAPAAVT